MSIENHKDHDQEAENRIEKNVKEFGWHIALFESTKYLPSFAYTIGLWQNYQHPEIICFGLNSETLHEILNIAGEEVKKGNRLKTSFHYDDYFENLPSIFLKVHENNISDYFGYAQWYNDYKPIEVLQLVWPDSLSYFPWEKKFDQDLIYMQPLLDRNYDFKFRESHNLGVYTSRHFLEDKRHITYVIHEDDGDWQFFTDDDVEESDMRMVSLKSMVDLDKSLNELFNLDYGEEATRVTIQDEWQRSKV